MISALDKSHNFNCLSQVSVYLLDSFSLKVFMDLTSGIVLSACDVSHQRCMLPASVVQSSKRYIGFEIAQS